MNGLAQYNLVGVYERPDGVLVSLRYPLIIDVMSNELVNREQFFLPTHVFARSVESEAEVGFSPNRQRSFVRCIQSLSDSTRAAQDGRGRRRQASRRAPGYNGLSLLSLQAWARANAALTLACAGLLEAVRDEPLQLKLL